MKKNQEQEIVNSLSTTLRLLNKCGANYRILGSMLVIAYSDKIFRPIADIDILLDEKSRDIFFKELKNNGFTIKKRSLFKLIWFEAEKPNHLGLTFLMIGNFSNKYFSYKVEKNIELRINNVYLTPTNYTFRGVEFIGIPLTSVVAGIKQSSFNPKRRFDREALKDEMKKDAKVYGNINVYLFGIKIPYLYETFSFVYNIYGALRAIFGFKYESW